ncbi:uncharacterized protein TNCV_872661 [Trichonephila clavipes]|nr:uncharacterized protein TNCV_872661 [Trichonephila clavipes]
MGTLIHLDTTLTGDRYASILSDHPPPFMSIVLYNGLGEFHQDNATPHTSRIATEWLQELNLDTSAGHQNPQTCALLNISGMPCNMLFRRDLHLLLLLLIDKQSCRIHGVNYLQHYFGY